MSDQLNVVVRNTFLHLCREDCEDDERSQKSRCNSAPPTCRHAKLFNSDCESEASTRCQTIACESSSFSDFGEDVSPGSPASSYEDLADSNVDLTAQTNASSNNQEVDSVYPDNAQQQLELMSDKIMDLWSKLRAVEMSSGLKSPLALDNMSPTDSGSVAAVSQHSGAAVLWMPVMGMVQPTTEAACAQEPARTPLKAPKLDGKAPAFTPSCKAFGGSHDVLTSVKQLLMLVQDVASVEVQFAAQGTLATIRIKTNSQAQGRANIIATAKKVLLEAAANSQMTYVLGYESEPFKDIDDSGFMCMLACLPDAWQCSACWETYQNGTCPRGKTCKWEHPGKKELQPVRVSVV